MERVRCGHERCLEPQTKTTGHIGVRDGSNQKEEQKSALCEEVGKWAGRPKHPQFTLVSREGGGEDKGTGRYTRLS